MTAKNNKDSVDDDSMGMLDDAALLDTTSIGILGGTAQVTVTLPTDDDDDFEDEGVLDGEIVTDLIIEDTGALDRAEIGRIHAAEIVIEIPAEVTAEGAEAVSAEAETMDAEPADAGPVDAEPADAEPADAEPADAESVDAEKADAEKADSGPVDAEVAPDVDEPAAVDEPVAVPVAADTPRLRSNTGKIRLPAKFVRGEDTVDPEAEPLAAREESVDTDDAHIDDAHDPGDTAGTQADTVGNEEPVKKESPVVDTSNEKAVAARAPESPRPVRSDVALTSRRLDEMGAASRESADLLTADRLLDPNQITKPEPEGGWSRFLYTVSGRRINIGDGKRARARKALSARIAAPISGTARFVPVLSRKGGVGKTTITVLLGMALADAREDRVIAVDANPDRGTLAERIPHLNHTKSVRDLVRIHDDVSGFHDLSAIVTRDATRLDVLASDSDPRIAEAFSDSDYRDVAGVAARYYSLVLTDTGTGIVHSVMSATLDLADQIIIVSGLSVDEARLASETLTWLETNGHADQVRDAIVVLNQSAPGVPLVRQNELETHFATRVKHVVRMPYDALIAGGGAIVFAGLQPETRLAARELAALLVEDLRHRSA